MSGIIAQNVGRHGGLIKASSGGGGAWTLISTVTSDGSDASLSFTSGIDSTYDEYVFVFNNIHAETNSAQLMFQVNADGESGFNETITSTFFYTYHNEIDTAAALAYVAGFDQGQGTSYQQLGELGDSNDFCGDGYLHLFNPSSTTFVKHFMARLASGEGVYIKDNHCAGYINTTAAITEIDFKMSADEIQGGSISLYGIG
jgi:hypothetical protein